jgi:uncharacterized protein DUF4396
MLTIIAWTSLALALVSALTIVAHLALGHPQHMWIMNIVWPVTALWAGPVALWAYFRFGGAGEARAFRIARRAGEDPPSRRQSFAVLAAKGTTHCGSGCTLGDICAELLVVAVPLSLFGHHIFGAWLYDFVLAFAFGIAFQYFTIQPMRHLRPLQALRAALEADTASLAAWQIGMYGWMAIATFVLFRHELQKGSPVFWFMMQIAMVFGFATSYPVNRWLLLRGVKESM